MARHETPPGDRQAGFFVSCVTIATGAFAEFALPTPSQPRDIVLGADGNLWFREFNAEALSQITPDGVVTRVQKVRGGPWGSLMVWGTTFRSGK